MEVGDSEGYQRVQAVGLNHRKHCDNGNGERPEEQFGKDSDQSLAELRRLAATPSVGVEEAEQAWKEVRMAAAGIKHAARDWIPTPPGRWRDLKRGEPFNVDVHLHDQQLRQGRRVLRCWHQDGKVEVVLHDDDEAWAHIPAVGPVRLKLRRCTCDFLTMEGPVLRFTPESCIRVRTDDQVSDTSVIELFGGIGGMASASRMVGATV